jgi:hypothetical protein
MNGWKSRMERQTTATVAVTRLDSTRSLSSQRIAQYHWFRGALCHCQWPSRRTSCNFQISYEWWGNRIDHCRKRKWNPAPYHSVLGQLLSGHSIRQQVMLPACYGVCTRYCYLDNSVRNWKSFLISSCFALLFLFIRFFFVVCLLPITVAAQSTAWTVFASSNTGIVTSNPTRGMDVCAFIPGLWCHVYR